LAKHSHGQAHRGDHWFHDGAPSNA